MENFEQYRNRKPYGDAGTEERKAWYNEQGRLDDLFWYDFAKEFDIEFHPKKEAFKRICWERGHSSGYSEVYNVALELIDLL
jgi:hypothetical protein